MILPKAEGGIGVNIRVSQEELMSSFGEINDGSVGDQPPEETYLVTV